MKTTFVSSAVIKKETKRVLVEDFETIIDLLYENYMILNTGKCHNICMGKDVGENKK